MCEDISYIDFDLDIPYRFFTCEVRKNKWLPHGMIKAQLLNPLLDDSESNVRGYIHLHLLKKEKCGKITNRARPNEF